MHNKALSVDKMLLKSIHEDDRLTLGFESNKTGPLENSKCRYVKFIYPV